MNGLEIYAIILIPPSQVRGSCSSPSSQGRFFFIIRLFFFFFFLTHLYAKGYSTKKNYLLQIGSRTISERYSEYYGVQDDGKAQEFRAQMKVAQSRIELRRANLPSNGQRGELVERLETHRAVRTQTLSE